MVAGQNWPSNCRSKDELLRGKEPKVVDVVTAVRKGYNRVRYFFEKRFYKLKGKIYLTGTPSFLTDRREVVFPDLEFDIKTRNVIVKVAAWILKTRITEQLRANVRIPLGGKLDDLKVALSAGLNRQLGSNAQMTGRVDSLVVNSVFIGSTGINARATADGRAGISVNWQF
ncbi:MAG: DUF4403 family protein [Pyrinomonadaceae bacterium]